MEVVPYFLVALLLDVPLLNVVIGFFVLYAIYEIGYVRNDIVAKDEGAGKTVRSLFSDFRLAIFLAVRIPVILILAFWGAKQMDTLTVTVAVGLVVLAITFELHNRALVPERRVATFLVLNVGKILVRLAMLAPLATVYVLAAAPHIMVKLIHYLGAKKLIGLDDATLFRLRVPIYLGFAVCMAIYDYRMLLIALPFFLNHCKSNIVRFAGR